MKKKNLIVALSFLFLFALWTVLISYIDVKSIGPNESMVGFATVNGFFHNLTGVHMWLYTVTDWLGLVPVAFGFGFAFLGLAQWIRRKNLFKVDYSLFILGVFYIVTFAAYILFEMCVINYRPVLINGYLEASYPSSTTLLVMCVMPTAAMQFYSRNKYKILRYCMVTAIWTFTILMVVGRLLSGVHWLTDIIGGALLSNGLVMLYRFFIGLKE